MSGTEGAVGYAALWVADLARAAAFYADALGWSYTEVAEQHRMVDDPTLPRSIVALAALPPGVWDEWPRHNTLFLSHAVDDLSGAVERVRTAGGRVHAADSGADCVDDQGMPFSLHTAGGAAPGTDTAHGRLAYLTFEVTDAARARAFLGAVFGWGFAPGNVEDGWQIDGLAPMGGLHGGH
ncbi:MAG: VOC family protein, partial [Actinomycetia bacterium]|nr:VOC family protein [Actinomycetes bacterium]